MKSALIILFGLLLCNPIFAQSSEKIIAIAKYQLVHHYDTLNYSLIRSEEFSLLINKNVSLFKSRDQEVSDSIIKINYEKTGFMGPSGRPSTTKDKIMIDFNNHLMFTTALTIIGKFKVKRAFPDIHWEIKPTIKNILGYRCQQAFCNYHGRKFIVWFTNDIPYKAGPWKLNGLPGLIIEAEDSTKRIKYELSSLKTIKGEQTDITLISEDISWDNYMKLVKSLMDNPHAYLEQQLGKKFTITPPMTPYRRNPMLPSTKINFPIEALEYYLQE
jgi:GLPGLI family protein